MMADWSKVAADVAEQLGVSISTLYAYVDGEGHAKPRALRAGARYKLIPGTRGHEFMPPCRESASSI
jgi:hypothetical protein